MQQEETQPCNVGPSSPSTTPNRNEDVGMAAFPIDLPHLGPTCTETVHIPKEQEFDENFIDLQKNLYNTQVRTLESEDDSVAESVEEQSEDKEGGGGLEDMVWPASTRWEGA